MSQIDNHQHETAEAAAAADGAVVAESSSTPSAAAAAAMQSDAGEARRYVDRLLGKGADAIVDDCFDTCVLELPEWYDDAKYKRAQKYFADNTFALVTGQLIGLISVLSIPSIIAVLMTANGSTSPMKAYRRYMQTIFHVLAWCTGDLQPGSRAWQSLESVRKRHVRVTLHSASRGTGIISQKDMAITQFAFFGFALARPHLVGLQVSAEDYEATVHFWRVIGYMVGMTDEYNLCTDRWETTHARVELTLSDVFRPALENESADFVRLSSALLNAFWCLNPLLHYGAFMYFVRQLVGCEGYANSDTDLALLRGGGGTAEAAGRLQKHRNAIGWYGRFNLGLHRVLHGSWMTCGWVRRYMNWHLRTAVWLIQTIPVLAIMQFGRKRAYVTILAKKDE